MEAEGRGSLLSSSQELRDLRELRELRDEMVASFRMKLRHQLMKIAVY